MQPTALDAPDAAQSRTSTTVDVIVALRADFASGSHLANQAEAAGIARSLGVSPRFAYGTALFGFAASVPEGRLNALRNDPRVAHVDFDAPVSIPDHVLAGKPGSGGSTAEVAPWGIKRIGADTNANEGSGVHVYIIDTGIDSDHPDLTGRLGNGYAVEKCRGGGCAGMTTTTTERTSPARSARTTTISTSWAWRPR
jgi:subtilisin